MFVLSRAVPPFPLYALIPLTGTAFTFTFHAASTSVSPCSNTKFSHAS